MKLPPARTYRLKPAQDAWLQATADKQGHGSKAVVVRQLVERAMRKTRKRSASLRRAS
jgi:hypothetical protein